MKTLTFSDKATHSSCNTEPTRLYDKDYRKEMMDRITACQSKDMREFLEANRTK